MKFVRNWPFCSQAFECICLKKRVCEKAKATASREHSGSFQSDIDGDGTCQCFCVPLSESYFWKGSFLLLFNCSMKLKHNFCVTFKHTCLELHTFWEEEKKEGKILTIFSTSKTQKQQFTCYLGKQCFFRSVAVFWLLSLSYLGEISPLATAQL